MESCFIKSVVLCAFYTVLINFASMNAILSEDVWKALKSPRLSKILNFVSSKMSLQYRTLAVTALGSLTRSKIYF